ncbi:MAG TPA: fumarylacetoacetate hydrolase family protein [Actinomycetota bacterium]|nr:fumarylacetoacetate hydrolase family protein [Actinomycetota bacterium]
MKLVSFWSGDSIVPGVLHPDGVIPLPADRFPSLEALIEAGPPGIAEAGACLSQAREVLPDPRLLRPLARPNSLRDFVAFEDHARAGAARRGEELNPIWYERPIYYKGNARSIWGPDEDLPIPSFTQELDFELEVACIIGKQIRDADEQSAANAIFGYTIMNDWSARDVQRQEMAVRLGPSKSKDFATSLGPCIVTADEFPDPISAKMTASVNGKIVCEANLADARWTFPQIIAYVSKGEDLYPTDVFGSGTPFGGCLLDQGGPYLKHDDEVELTVENIGTLKTRIIQPGTLRQ